MSNLLIHEPALQVLPTLAAKIGLNEAIFLQQLHYWLKQTRHWRDGRPWVYNTVAEWEKQFPFWSAPTIRRIVNNLREMGLVIATNEYNKMPIDKTLWYTIDYAKVPSDDFVTSSDQGDHSNDQLDQLERSDCAHVNDQSDHTNNQRLPENTTETTGREGASALPPPADPPKQLVRSRQPASRTLRITSPYLKGAHFENGYIPEGAGQNAVQVYYERFCINETAAILSDVQEDDLVRLCPDLDRLRAVVTAYSRTNYRRGNVQIIIDGYNGRGSCAPRKDTHHANRWQRGAELAARDEPEVTPEQAARWRANAAKRRARIEAELAAQDSAGPGLRLS